MRAGFYQKFHQGFSFFEVLIAALMLSLNMLALSGLYRISLQAYQHAQQQLSALFLADDLAERFFINHNAFYSETSSTENAALCFWQICDPQQLADFDLANWTKEVDQQLINGKGVFCQESYPYEIEGRFIFSCATSSNPTPRIIKLKWHTKPSKIEHTLALENSAQFLMVSF